MKALADALIAAVAAYDNHPAAIRRLQNVKALATALDRSGPIIADLTAGDDSPEAAALEAAVQAIEAALAAADPAAARYMATRLLEAWPQSVNMPAGGWAYSWEEVA